MDFRSREINLNKSVFQNMSSAHIASLLTYLLRGAESLKS